MALAHKLAFKQIQRSIINKFTKAFHMRQSAELLSTDKRVQHISQVPSQTYGILPENYNT
jgi:hypothetical protein